MVKDLTSLTSTRIIFIHSQSEKLKAILYSVKQSGRQYLYMQIFKQQKTNTLFSAIHAQTKKSELISYTKY